MRRILYLPTIVFAILSIYSCAEYDNETPVQRSPERWLTVTDARISFEEHWSMTRSETDAAESSAVATLFSPGNYAPNWNSGVSSENERIGSVDVSIESEYSYYVVYSAVDSVDRFMPVYQGVVVVKGRESQTTYPYLVMYIPDSSHVSAFTPAVCARYRNSFDKTGFSGTVLYTTTAGFPVCFNRFEAGECTDAVFIGDTTLSKEYRYRKLVDEIWQYRIARSPKVVATRLQGDDPVDIDPVVVVAPPRWRPSIDELFPPRNGGRPVFGDNPGQDKFAENNRRPDLGGGGVPAGSGDSRFNTDNKTIDGRLDSLSADCIGRKLIENLLAHDITFVSSDAKGSVFHYEDSWNGTGRLTGTITINPAMSDVVYIEELTHVMQIASDYSSVTAKLNLEVEAKVVWLYFAKTHNMRTLGFKEVFGGDANYRAFVDLTRYISDMMHGYDSGYNRETVDMLYDICAGGLRNNVQYADEKRYPYDESRKNYEIIRQLIEGC